MLVESSDIKIEKDGWIPAVQHEGHHFGGESFFETGDNGLRVKYGHRFHGVLPSQHERFRGSHRVGTGNNGVSFIRRTHGRNPGGIRCRCVCCCR